MAGGLRRHCLLPLTQSGLHLNAAASYVPSSACGEQSRPLGNMKGQAVECLQGMTVAEDKPVAAKCPGGMMLSKATERALTSLSKKVHQSKQFLPRTRQCYKQLWKTFAFCKTQKRNVLSCTSLFCLFLCKRHSVAVLAVVCSHFLSTAAHVCSGSGIELWGG